MSTEAAGPGRRAEEGGAELVELVERLGQPCVLVVGDLILDRYVWGDAARISQEAPVLLLQADRREERLGGASSVAGLLRALGARVALAGVVGADADGLRLRQGLEEQQIEGRAVVAVDDRPTTVKERYIGRAQHKHPQQMLRVDYEVRRPVPAECAGRLLEAIQQELARADIVLISDYGKGACTPALLAGVSAAARERGLRTLVDPVRGGDYRIYRGVSAITPNRLEAGLACGAVVDSPEAALACARRLREELELEAALVTLDREGIALAHRDGRRRLLPTRPREVYDITGAGDMVLAVLGMALAAGADYEPAARLANIAGGLEVEKIGVAPVSRAEILHDLRHGRHGSAGKTWPRAALVQEVSRLQSQGKRIVFTNGCFDVLHAGHVQYLQEARAQGDRLIVGLNSDAGVRALKGPSRPVNPVEARALVLSALEAVDYLTVFEEPTPLELIEALRPDVLVKGADYQHAEVVGALAVEAWGGRVHLARLREGCSTTRLLERLGAA